MSSTERTPLGDKKASAVSRMISNAAVLVPAAGATLTFAGHSYYERLFQEFALKPGVIELTPIDFAARGVDVLIFAPFALAIDHWRSVLWQVPAALIVGGVIGLGLRRISPGWRRNPRVRRALRRFDRWQARAMRWLTAILVLAIGYGAGAKGGAYDAAGIRAARRAAVNCYTVDGLVIRGIPLGQDKDTIVLVEADRTVVRSFGTIDVAKCAEAPASSSCTAIANRRSVPGRTD